MGYLSLGQTGLGIHLRQFARTFIIDDGTNRTVFVSTDTLGTSLYVRQAVLTQLFTFKPLNALSRY